MIKKIEVRVDTREIGYNFTTGKEYLVKESYSNGFLVEDDHGEVRFVPRGYASLTEYPSCPIGEINGEHCEPNCCEVEDETKG
jgi:hypothetical protein